MLTQIFSTIRRSAWLCLLGAPLATVIHAGAVYVPNGSFESPEAPRVSPYAFPDVDDWQKTPPPFWYDPSKYGPWEQLAGTFYNVPFPGVFIDNCDGQQAVFLFAQPDAGLFQDYTSLSGTNTIPSHAFNATFNAGSAYDLTVGVIGGSGNMSPGVTLQLSLYYRDAASNLVTVAATSITNSTELFPTNTHFVDFQVHVPTVRAGDSWAGKNIGIQLLSTASFALAGGYWDLDHVRLVEVPFGLSQPALTSNAFTFTIQSEPGLRFEILASTNLATVASNWNRIGTFTNFTGRTNFSDSFTNSHQRYYRAEAR